MPTDPYLDVGPALTGGYRVILVKGGDRIQSQAIFESLRDVVAAAKLMETPILSKHDTVRALCRSCGVRLIESEAGR